METHFTIQLRLGLKHFSLTASLMGSGINGNDLGIVTVDDSTTTASLMGSGINGNSLAVNFKSCGVISKPLPLWEVELMETKFSHPQNYYGAYRFPYGKWN